MRANDGRQKTMVREGDRRKSYDAERMEDISTRRNPDRCARVFILLLIVT